MIRIEHVALWVKDLELMKNFYCKYFAGTANQIYRNPKKGFSSYFISFASGARLELMHSSNLSACEIGDGTNKIGLAHLAISLGSKESVDTLTQKIASDGYKIIGYPRTTGDGYYESCILDPENNQIELTI